MVASAQPEPRGAAIRRRTLAVGFILTALIGCAPASPLRSHLASSEGPASSASPGALPGSMPRGCELIELRAPDGSPVELDGTWIEQSRTTADRLFWWIRTQGDCLYGVGTLADVPVDAEATDHGQVIQYIGTTRPDFSIEGLMVHVGTPNFLEGEVPPVSETRFLIEFTGDGGIQLREDREAGVITGGPRCLHQSFCFPPLVLVPREN